MAFGACAGVNDDEVGDVAAVDVGGTTRLLVADVNDVTACAIVQACATPGVAAVA